MSTVPTSGPITYVAACLYGLESVLAAEVRERLGAKAERHWCEAVFPFAGSPAELRELRTAGHLSLQFDRFPIGHTVPDLAQLDARLRALPLDLWEAKWRDLQDLDDTAVCVNVSRKGEHNYTYAQVQELAIDALAATGRRASLDPHPLELRVDIHAGWCRLLGRLTARSAADRAYRRYRDRSQTEPTLAAAMVRLARPDAGDVFLDPFCGVGTIPIERALTAPAARIVAGDVSAKRLQWAAENARRAEAPVSFARWDGARLPFRAGTFTAVVTSPPQNNPAGGRPWRTADFARLVEESLRVLRYGGRAVWLVQRKHLFGKALKRLHVSGRHRERFVTWKGRPWIVHIVEKPLSGTA